MNFKRSSIDVYTILRQKNHWLREKYREGKGEEN